MSIQAARAAMEYGEAGCFEILQDFTLQCVEV
jgi:hypothetical protein